MLFSKLRRLAALTLIPGAVLFLAGCPQEQGPVENAGEAVDDAAEDVGDAVEDVADDAEDAAEVATGE